MRKLDLGVIAFLLTMAVLADSVFMMMSVILDLIFAGTAFLYLTQIACKRDNKKSKKKMEEE
jgi:hypothetical protein